MSSTRRSRSRTRRRQVGGRRALSVAAVVVALIVGGALFMPRGDSDPSAEPDPVPVSMVEMAFIPADIEIRPGQPLLVSNEGAERHNLLVIGLAKGVELAPGQAATTLDLPPDATGRFDIICDLPGHREAGMVGTLTVGSRFEPATSADPG